MNRTDIVKSIAYSQKVPAATVSKVLTGLFDVVGLSLATGESIVLRDFGKFVPRSRRAITRNNPLTGLDINVPAKNSVGFIPSQTLKARLNPQLVKTDEAD